MSVLVRKFLLLSWHRRYHWKGFYCHCPLKQAMQSFFHELDEFRLPYPSQMKRMHFFRLVMNSNCSGQVIRCRYHRPIELRKEYDKFYKQNAVIADGIPIADLPGDFELFDGDDDCDILFDDCF